MGVELTSPTLGFFYRSRFTGQTKFSLPRQGKSQMTVVSFPKCHVFILPVMVSLTQSHIVSHVFRSDQVCWFVQVCSILFRPQLPHILKAMSKAAGKGSVPPPPPSGMITMEAESIPSKSLERKGAWRSWTILNNMTLVKRKHRSSWIILFSLHFSVIAVRFVAVFWFLQHLQLGGYGKSAGKASGKAAGKGSQDKSSALSTWSRFTFRNFLNISFCSFTALRSSYVIQCCSYVFDSVRLVPLFSTFPLVGGVTAALLLLRTLVVFRASHNAGHCPIAF